MIPEVHAYLEQPKPDFLTGFGLFCKYTRNENLVRAISRKKSMELLLYQLRKLDAISAKVNPKSELLQIRYSVVTDKSEPLPETTIQVPVPDTEPAKDITWKTFDERKTRRSDLPETLQVVYDRIIEDSKFRRTAHEKMKLASTDADRAKFRAQILKFHENIKSGWKQIDDYLSDKAKQESFQEFKESTLRAFISKMLKKDSLTPVQEESVRLRVKALQEHGCTLSDKTLRLLQSRNLVCPK